MPYERIIDWENVYKTTKVTDMPWYNPELDTDLHQELDRAGLYSGSFLDLGTGPATQAFRLHERGFKVTGIDISKKAIALAKSTYKDIRFINADILTTKLSDKFDFIFDRGCFHVIDENKRETYVKNVSTLISGQGLLFLKCFSDKEPENGMGPYRISEKIIRDTFERSFIIQSIKETEFIKPDNTQHIKALFVTMKKP